jgi:hypothetical protein
MAHRVGRRFDALRDGLTCHGAIHSVFTRAANIDIDGSLYVLSVGENINPRAAELFGSSLDGLGLDVGQPCHFNAELAIIGPVRLDLSRSSVWTQKLHRDWRMPCTNAMALYYRENIGRLAPGAVSPRHIDPERVRQLGYASSADAAARGLIGLGMGLTPAGDDIVLGALVAARHLVADDALASTLEDTICARAQTTSALSCQMLTDALAGDYHEALDGLVFSLGRADRAGVDSWLARLLRMGASSGRDTAAGIAAVLRAQQRKDPQSATPSPALTHSRSTTHSRAHPRRTIHSTTHSLRSEVNETCQTH